MTDNKNDAGMSALLILKTEGEGLAKQGAAIARANAFDSDMDVIAANNKLSVMRIKATSLNSEITRLAAENSELRALLEKRNEILGKIRAGIKAKIMSSDALATVLVNYGKKSGMTPEDMKKDVASATEIAREASESYTKKADGQLVKAGADEEVMAAVNAAVGLAVDPRKAPQGT